MRARILFLATSADVSTAIAAMLESNDFQVAQSDDAERATSRLAGEHFDLLVVEVKASPDDEGLRFLRHVRATAPHLGTRTVAISGAETEHLQRELDAIGICDLVLKPIHEDDILAAVHECLDPTPSTVH